jgi:hypothetical protein
VLVAENEKSTTETFVYKATNDSVVPLSDRPKVLSAKAPATKLRVKFTFSSGSGGKTLAKCWDCLDELYTGIRSLQKLSLNESDMPASSIKHRHAIAHEEYPGDLVLHQRLGRSYDPFCKPASTVAVTSARRFPEPRKPSAHNEFIRAMSTFSSCSGGNAAVGQRSAA